MSDNRTSKVFDGGVEGHARYASQAHPALGCQDGRNGVPDTNAKPVAGIKPGPSDTTPSSRPEVDVEELRDFIYVRQPCHSMDLARALLAKYHMKGRE